MKSTLLLEGYMEYGHTVLGTLEIMAHKYM